MEFLFILVVQNRAIHSRNTKVLKYGRTVLGQYTVRI